VAARFENLATLPNGALNQPVTVPENGRRREITKREAVFAQAREQIRFRRSALARDLLDLLVNLEQRRRWPTEVTRISLSVVLPERRASLSSSPLIPPC
jgi:hypothetical protein